MQTGHELNRTFHANLESFISQKWQVPGVLSVVLTLASLSYKYMPFCASLFPPVQRGTYIARFKIIEV